MEERYVTVDGERFPSAGGFPDRGDAESARLRGHLSAARVAARPLHDLRADGLPEPENEARILVEYGLPGSTPRARSRSRRLERGALEPRASRARQRAHVRRARSATCSTSSRRRGRRRASGSACRAAPRSRSRAARASKRRCAAAEFVVPDDVKRVAPWVIPHRLVLAPDAVLEGASAARGGRADPRVPCRCRARRREPHAARYARVWPRRARRRRWRSVERFAARRL